MRLETRHCYQSWMRLDQPGIAIILAIITTITFCASRCLLLKSASLFPHSLLVPPSKHR